MYDLLLLLFFFMLVVYGDNDEGTMVSTRRAVQTVSRRATFDFLVGVNQRLEQYLENSLNFTTIGSHCCKLGMFYVSYGNYHYVTVRGTDSALFLAMEFNVTDGLDLAIPTTNVRWQTYRRSKLVGDGIEKNVPRDIVVSFYNPFGFDELRVAAGADTPGFGAAQSIGIDDFRAWLYPTARR
jgi:hypothetical protein